MKIFEVAKLSSQAGAIDWQLFDDTADHFRRGFDFLKMAAFAKPGPEQLDDLQIQAAESFQKAVGSFIRDQRKFDQFAREVLKFETAIGGLIDLKPIQRQPQQ